MTEKEYREHPAISRSELFKISESPEKFRFYKDTPISQTPSLLFGQVFHKLALQPEGFKDEFAVLPEIDRRTKSGKELYSEFLNGAEGKTLVDKTTFDKAAAMCESLYKNPYVGKLIKGEIEKPYFWVDEDTGEECKCRLDCETGLKNTSIIVDLKSANSADCETFMRDAIKYGYDFQAAMYIEGARHNTGKDYSFVFIVVEKEPPYSVNIFQADKLFLQRGYDLFREYIGIYHECKQSGEWYGYLGKYNMINNLSLPSWLAKEIE